MGSSSITPVLTRQKPPHSIFASQDRVALCVILALIGLWSAISGTIHVPALPTLERYFGVTASEINISVVMYSVFQGITPTFTLTLADLLGRRPVLLACVIGYTSVCIAISQIRAFWLLLFLRCLQAASIAPVIAIGLGVAGDVCTPETRGGFVGVVSGFILVGNGLGGLIGSALLSLFGWRGIFEFLAIGSGATFVLAFFMLPETHRSLVGNGLVSPSRWYLELPYIHLPHFKQKMNQDHSTIAPKVTLNFLEPLKILVQPEVVSLLFPVGIHYASWLVCLTSISSMEKKPYMYSVIHIGLVYLPQGIALLVGPFLTGYLLNYFYRVRYNAWEEKHKRTPKVERPPFDIFIARLIICLPATLVVVAGLFIFGWCLGTHQNSAAIIVSSTLVSLGTTSYQSAVTTLLVDLYPDKGSMLTSCLNLVRCLLAALFVGVLDKMTTAMGLGGTYSFLAGICLVSNVLLLWVGWGHTGRKATGDQEKGDDMSEL